MSIGRTLLYNTYAGNLFFDTRPGTARQSQSTGPGPAAPVSTPESGNTSAGNLRKTAASGDVNGSEKTNNRSPRKNNGGQNGNDSETRLKEEDLKAVRQLKQRDREVRAHEAAHLAAAGKYATGGATFEYRRGPDGKSYAVGGEVGIDTSPVPNDPRATMQKARQIKAAAQAPANPSAADRQVAASAAQMEAKAQREVAELRLNELDKSSEASEKPDVNPGVDKGVSESGNRKNTALSTYRDFDELFRAESDAPARIDLRA